MLPMDFFDLQIVPIQDDPEQEFRTRLIFKDLAHKVIIHEPKITDTPQIFLMLTLKIKVFCVSTSAIGSPAFCSLSKVRIP